MDSSTGQGIEPSFLKSVFETNKYSDLVLKCENRTWNVHKFALCSKSPFFESACEPTPEEAFYGDRKEITLHEHDPDMVEHMLLWCYGQDYHEKLGNVTNGQKAIIDANVYALAHKYSFIGLKIDARDELLQNFSKALYQISEVHPDLTHLINAIEIAYTVTPASDRLLRRAVVSALRHYQPLMMQIEDFKQLFKSGLADGQFAYDLLECWTDAINSREFLCKQCVSKPRFHFAKTRKDIECSVCTKQMASVVDQAVSKDK